jgi:predicted TPR repeat methyltransferase
VLCATYGYISFMVMLPPLHLSTGDPRADTRFAYAQSYWEEGDIKVAFELAQQVLELAPDFAPAYTLLGRALLALNRGKEAVSVFHQALSKDEQDLSGAGLELAKLGILPEKALREGFIRSLFDAYAPRFEAHLTQELHYRAPLLMMNMLEYHFPQRHYNRVLDIGCGTGLMGEAIRPHCAWLAGCDLSPVMMAQAQMKGVYDHLAAEEAIHFLKKQTDQADLILAADVLVYMGDLALLFFAAEQVMHDESCFVFTVQDYDGSGFQLGDDARYAHSKEYVKSCLANRNLIIFEEEDVSTRRDQGKDVAGTLYLVKKK